MQKQRPVLQERCLSDCSGRLECASVQAPSLRPRTRSPSLLQHLLPSYLQLPGLHLSLQLLCRACGWARCAWEDAESARREDAARREYARQERAWAMPMRAAWVSPMCGQQKQIWEADARRVGAEESERRSASVSQHRAEQRAGVEHSRGRRGARASSRIGRTQG